jgi:hypothetical protein
MTADRTRDRGAADALGLVLIAPAVIGLAILVVAFGRGVDAAAQVRSAAEASAQAAALERDPSSASVAANRVARAMLTDADTCSNPSVTVRYPSAASGGSGLSFGLVEVTIDCEVLDRGIEIVLSGARHEAVKAVAAVDFCRAVGRP